MARRRRFYIGGVLAAAMVCGCGGDPREELPPPTEEDVRQPVQQKEKPRGSAEPRATPDAERSPGRPLEEMVSRTEDADASASKPLLTGTNVPFRLVALLTSREGRARAGLLHMRSGDSRLVMQGEVFDGYRVDEIDLERERVRMTSDHHAIELGMAAMTYAETSDEPVSDGPLPAAFDPRRTALNFTPTEQERAAGIDPNDPSTWPADYRGPGIERAMAAAGSPTNDVPVSRRRPDGTLVERFVPTASERDRGIDPNDASTWPEDYRGPGIERATRARSAE